MSGMPDKDVLRKHVRETYAKAARNESAGCCSGSSCCSGAPVAGKSTELGYSPDDLAALPKGADMGLGSGNPITIADLKPGEVVLDLGSGGGIDCFLAAGKVGTEGRAIGVDMTPEMIEKARANAAQGGFRNVEFRLGEIEHIPAADNSVDAVISNCVINLSPDKPAVYSEIFRVLKPGGRVAISDVVTKGPVPDEIRNNVEMMCGCISNAAPMADIERMLADAGFKDIELTPDEESESYIREWAPGTGAEKFATAAAIKAVKPRPE